MKYKLFIVTIIFIAMSLVLSGCSSNYTSLSPSYADASLSPATQSSENTISISGILPQSVYRKYIILQDYADNETSRVISEGFANELNDEASLVENADHRLELCGRDFFIIVAAVPFENGALICGRFLIDGESYSQLYYFESGKITWSAKDSDVWSLNYTVFKNHTIAFGESTGFDNKVVMQSKVTVEFADGEILNQYFKNIPLKSEKDGWSDGSIQTDGYILIADGLTWVKNIQFFGKDGAVQNDWHSDLYHTCVFDSGPAYVWSDKPNEIWTVYRYSQMLNDAYRDTMRETTPVSIQINGENAEFQRFLLNESIGIEYVWRNNNNYRDARMVNNISDIKLQGVNDSDSIIWVSLDKDDGGPISDYSSLCSDKTPTRKGTYCLIINHNPYVLKHEDMCFSIFIKLV